MLIKIILDLKFVIFFFLFQPRAVLAALAEAEVLAVVDVVGDTTPEKDSKQNCEEQIFRNIKHQMHLSLGTLIP